MGNNVSLLTGRYRHYLIIYYVFHVIVINFWFLPLFVITIVLLSSLVFLQSVLVVLPYVFEYSNFIGLVI